MDDARRRTLHGRRRGKKLRAGQQSLLDTLLPRLLLALPADAARKIDLAQAFGGSLPPDGIWLEIGFGAGEHLVWQAEQHPGVGLIGCEPYLNGVAKCLAHIERAGVANVRLFTDDARFLPWMIEHACTHPAFDWLAERPADWRGRPADWPATRYEKKMLAGKPVFLRLARR